MMKLFFISLGLLVVVSSCQKVSYTCTGFAQGSSEAFTYKGLTELEREEFEKTHDPKSCIEEQ